MAGDSKWQDRPEEGRSDPTGTRGSTGIGAKDRCDRMHTPLWLQESKHSSPGRGIDKKETTDAL